MKITEVSIPIKKLNPSQCQKNSNSSFAKILNGKKDTGKEELISLGVLNKNNPTVSNLLIKNPELKNDCWKIVHNAMNKNKSYTKIYSDTEIFINKQNQELSWCNSKPVVSEKKNAKASFDKQPPEPGQKTVKPEPSTGSYSNISKDEKISDKNQVLFEKAVKSCIGTKYNELDCYELLVSGMEKMGVKYRGKGGLSEYLSMKASSQGLPSNSFKTGEGIVELSGKKLFSKSIPSSITQGYSGKELLNELAPYLKPGDILSFSTQGKGHTGIVSQKDNEWTFVNSGILDNSTGHTKIKKGVGEELLHKELGNWLRLASKRKESLMITSGRLDHNKLSRFVVDQKTKETEPLFTS